MANPMNYRQIVLDLLLKKQLEEGWNEMEVAQWAGATPQQWSNWKDRRGVSNTELVGVMERLGIPVSRLLRAALEQGVTPDIEDGSNVEPGPAPRGECPLISWVTAGSFEPTSDPFLPGEAEDWFQCPVKHSEHTYVLRVRGDSMDAGNGDGYRDGDLIFVDPMQAAKSGDDVIVRIPERDETTFKRLKEEGGRPYLVPLNPNWPEKIILLTDSAVVKGVVIFSGRIRK